MEDPVVTDTNRYYDKQANLERIHEGVEEQVSKMSLRDVVWELTELMSNRHIYNEVANLIESTWRSQGVSATIDELLQELTFNGSTNWISLISHLDLESKVREMLKERMIDREMEDLE